MTWQFRKSFRANPAVRVKLSRGGVRASIGSGGELAADSSLAKVLREYDYASASTAELSSGSLRQLAEVLLAARQEQGEIEKGLRAARAAAAAAQAKYASWEAGFFLKRILSAHFASLREKSATGQACVAELEEQFKQSAVSTEIEIPEDFKGAFGGVCDAFSRLADSERIWDTVSGRDVDQFRERSAATEAISRHEVKFGLGQSPIVACGLQVPQLRNANGGDLLLYPAFVLYSVTPEQFALIAPWEVKASFASIRFTEIGKVPSDSKVIGSTWLKVNKDGTPDRRFKENYEIPEAHYGEIHFTSKSGLNEKYLISNAPAAKNFAAAWTLFTSSFSQAS